MKQKLLYLFIGIFFSAASYAQQYGQPANLTQCNSEVFNLTVNAAAILNGQDPSQHILSYHLSQAEAVNGVNPILNPNFFITQQGQIVTIFVRISFNEQFQIRTFTVQWDFIQNPPPVADVIGCDAYVLPPLQMGQYRSQPNGGGVVIPVGFVVTVTSQIFIYYGSAICNPNQSFTVTILNAPLVDNFPSVIACGMYTLPALTYPGSNYYTGPGGTGMVVAAGTAITASTTLYIFNSSGAAPACVSESVFTIIINQGTTPTLSLSPSETEICPGIDVLLTATTNHPSPAFQWFENGQIIPGATSNIVIASPFSTSSYQCLIESNCGQVYSNPATIFVDALTEVLVNTSGETCVGGTFTLSVANPNPDVEYVWTQPIGGSPATSTDASSITISSATLSDNGTYTVTATNSCGTIMVMNIFVEVANCNANTISGHVRLDADNNGCSANDGGVPNLAVHKLVGNNVITAYTDAQGKYMFTNIPEGNNALMLQNPLPSGLVLTSPIMVGPHYIFDVIGDNNNLTGDFCVAAPQPVVNAMTYFYATNAARPGFPAQYVLIVNNQGSQPISGSAFLQYNHNALDFANASPSNVSLNSFQSYAELGFNFVNIPAYSYYYIYINFTVKVPPIVNGGDILNFNASIDVQNDANPIDNSASLAQTVVNSYDPNDIIVRQGESIYESEVGDYLDYMIRFQNTGTADAINVRVTNQLDALLDWSTFTPVASSHLYRTERINGNVTFSFDNINLPAQSVDDAGSNGFVTYRIKPKPNVGLGDIMKAQANIYFDFNLPIITNEVSTEVVEMMGVKETAFANLRLHPNPASGKVTIDFNDTLDAEILVYDIQGKTILKRKASGKTVELNVSSVKAGIYFVKISSGNESVMKKLIVR